MPHDPSISFINFNIFCQWDGIDWRNNRVGVVIDMYFLVVKQNTATGSYPADDDGKEMNANICIIFSNLSGNPLRCSCSDKPYFQQFKADTSILTGHPTCQNVQPPNTQLKDLDLTAPPFDKCDGTIKTTGNVLLKI
jgi:hypothetical protein